VRDLVAMGPDSAVGAEERPLAASPAAREPLVLGPDGGLGWDLELPAGGELEVEAWSPTGGTLVVSASSGPDPEELVLPLRAEHVAFTLPLPAGGLERLALALRWTPGSGDGPLLIDVLRLTEPDAPERPSIVFISIDTLAARHTSLHGYPRETTPALDAFAADAIVFERCTANACWTTPSYMAQLTGLYPDAFSFELGDGAYETLRDFHLGDGHTTLAEALRAAGYRTAAFVDNLQVAARMGFGQGFEVYDSSAAEISYAEIGGGIDHVTDLALRWLDDLQPDEPYFLFVQAMDAHGPYLPAEGFDGRFAEDPHVHEEVRPIARQPGVLWSAVPRHVAEPHFAPAPAPERMQTAEVVTAYDEEILAVDDSVGRFLRHLAERGVGARAAIVFSADHGEAMVEHESLFDHYTVYEETTHVPLVLRLPGGAGGGARISDQVQLVDLAPTLARIAGLTTFGEGLHGRDLVPLARGLSADEHPALAIGALFSGAAVTHEGWKLVETRPNRESGLPCFLSSPRARAWLAARYPELEGSLAGVTPTTVFLEAFAAAGDDPEQILEELERDIEGPWYELFFLPDDPSEQTDLSEQHPDKVDELRALLESERARGRSALIEPDQPHVPIERTAEEQAELNALGYGGEGRGN
jgi:arylsulfatase A-like enzyme